MKNWILFTITAVAAFLLALLAVNIFERKSEAKFAYQPKVEINHVEPRDSVWGLNFPRQYQSYMKTKDTTFKSMYGTAGHQDLLATDPELVIVWAGYGFSKDYNAPKGHAWAIEDLQKTLRTGAPMEKGDGPMPATCWTCKSPDVPRLMNEVGVAEYYTGKWGDKGHEVINPIGCADCHDPKTMKLTITRPALVEAFEAMGQDINKASHQEMRSLVCAQCHVEYYFDGKKPGMGKAKYLTFPWKEGMKFEDMEKYYDNINFADWVHPISKTRMLKAQHPDYEIFKESVHAKRGVSCADCHMPYQSEGGQKFTNHHMQSPLANVEKSCFVCHRENAEDLITDVYERQSKIKKGTKKLLRLIAMAHIEAGKAWELGATQKQMDPIQQGIRHAQWRWDYSVASHGAAFHAPLETSRTVTSATDIVQETRVKLARLLAELGHNKPVAMPNFKSKEALQKYIGLDAKKMKSDKKKFMETIVPKWLEEGKKREAKKPVKMVTASN